MAQLFPKYTNTLARLALPGLMFGVGGVAWAWHTALFSSYATQVGVAPPQPVPFSHEHHVAGLGIDCRYCHTSVETAPFAGMPATETCMTCHSQVWRDAPVLEPVRASWTSGRPLRWTRVHDLPDYTYFDHSIHVQKGVACVSCHGRVDKMPMMMKANTLYMRWCLECHRAPEKHLQPGSEVFAMRDEPAHGSGLGVSHTKLEDCSICHR